MARVLMVDDDAHIRELVRITLENAGFTVIEASHGVEALSIIETTKLDLCIVDVMMPEKDGWDVCREIRKTSTLPILMLTALGETANKLKGFQLGVDDYLVKPFDPLELVARVKAILKRYRIQAEQIVKLGHLTLHRGSNSATVDGRAILLPRKEFDLLFKLSVYSGQILTREQLIEDIWGFDYEGDERTVDVHIKRLRERFSDESYTFKIVTIRGLGYRLEVNS